ncbi:MULTISPECIES: hypothetical protein [unclassified Bradyrhizobium]|nr:MULTISPECIES: hypothetical protein [unclassified Bradyrhizobium]
MTNDPIIGRSDAQRAARLEQLRAELAELGYVALARMRWRGS